MQVLSPKLMTKIQNTNANTRLNKGLSELSTTQNMKKSTNKDSSLAISKEVDGGCLQMTKKVPRANSSIGSS